MAVAGGTGVVGRYVVAAAQAAGHEVTVLSRRSGVDVRDEEALRAVLDGADVVVDTLHAPSLRRGPAEAFFTRTSGMLQRVGSAAEVRHLVVLSILGIDRAPGYGYYQAKLAQERVAREGPVAVTILRATQFHEFPAQVLRRTRKGPLALMFRMRSQPVAARTVGAHLVRAAETQPGGTLELAGPEVHEMPALARRLLRARGLRAFVVPVPLPGASAAVQGGALLATASTTIDGPPFGQWLAQDDALAVPL